MPDVEWEILIGIEHTNVVSKDKKLVFDILYFDEDDKETYGGKNAIECASKYLGEFV